MDIGDWAYPTAPGFVKRYCRKVRKLLKAKHARKCRRAARRRAGDRDRADEPVAFGHNRPSHYEAWTRFEGYRR